MRDKRWVWIAVIRVIVGYIIRKTRAIPYNLRQKIKNIGRHEKSNNEPISYPKVSGRSKTWVGEGRGSYQISDTPHSRRGMNTFGKKFQ